MSHRLRVAVVGTGAWWGREHARLFAGRPDTELCAIVGRTPAKTEARAAEFGTRGYTDLNRMLEVERPDLVSVCLPNQGHFEPTLQLIRAGVPLFVEKPLVFDLDEADTLLSEASQRDLFFAINFNHRYARPVQLTKSTIDSGELGEVVFATWRFGGEPNDGASPHRNLIETQCHGFDMLEHLCGPIESVAAQMTDLTGRDFSTMVVALRFASGAVGVLVGSYDSSYAYPLTHLVEVNGTAGRAVIEDTVRRWRMSRTGEETSRVWEAGYFNDDDRSFHRTFDRHADDVLNALRAGEKPPIHARAGRRALSLAMATIESFDTGRRIDGLTPAAAT
jgi:myo-inositol 2-dehydrogenase/D-chiro-inositol 1-dehydrogenase